MAGTLDISQATVTEGAWAGTAIAGVLTINGGLGGTTPLEGTANQIGTISNFMATGSLAVVDGTAMTVAGLVGADAGNVFVTTGAHTLSFAAGGVVGVGERRNDRRCADGLANLGVPAATGVLNAGPRTAGGWPSGYPTPSCAADSDG